MTKIAIIGSRGFDNPKLFKKELEIFLEENSIDVNSYKIVSGGAKGADYLAKMYWKSFIKDLFKYLEFKPDWDKHGKSAGFKRNYEIWNNSDIGIAFWDGESKGTAHSFKISKDQNKKLKVINYNSGEKYYV